MNTSFLSHTNCTCKKRKSIEDAKSNLQDRLLKLSEWRSFKWIYSRSGLGVHIKKNYNYTYRKSGRKFSIDKLYALIKELMIIEVRDKDGNDIKFLSTNRTLNDISIRIISKREATT